MKRKYKREYSGQISFLATYLFAFIFLLAEWFLFAYSIGISYPNFFGTCLKGIGDISILLAVYFLLNRQWRWIVVAIVWIVSFFFLINCFYFRFWNDLIPSSVFATTANFDSNLFDYAGSLIRLADLAFIVLPVLYLLIFIVLRPYAQKIAPLRFKMVGVAGSLFLFFLGQFSYMKSSWEYLHAIGDGSHKEYFKTHYLGNPANYNSLYIMVGLPVYFIKYTTEIAKLKLSVKKLNADEQKRIKNYLQNLNKISLQKAQKNKNIVFIIVESLNSDVIGKKIGDFQITPTLDSLMMKEGTIFFDHVVSQVKSGGSSDGQMVLLTGLLPLDYGSAAVSFSNNDYPSIPKLLNGYHSEVFVADDGLAWNQKSSLENYGFKKVHTINDFIEEAKKDGRDRALFNYFLERKPQLKEPFFVTLITMSMHVPFKEESQERIDIIDSQDTIIPVDKDYLTMVNYFDSSLKELLKQLDDETLVILASDHSQNLVKLSDNPLAAYMALHTDTTAYITRIVGQANLFPVTMDITGISGSEYRGVAPTAFDETVDGSVDGFGKVYGNLSLPQIDSIGKEFEISDLIIRGNYFKLNPFQ